MNIREFIPNIHYVGVNDRVSSRFEALWPLPYGVSYNSYFVKAGKCALIDTVELASAHDFFDHLHEVNNWDPIDYLIINHMEPDHSGSIPLILEAYPDIKIVGNRQTIQMLNGFYHICDPRNLLEVADGDTIDLGGKTLRFYLTPMVHWPETMMTYVEEDHILFSGDAFGTFGALCGGIVDEEMDTEVYFREAYRYYSNIVGKYGAAVVRALKKIEDLHLDYVCPTHGPVWHSELPRIAEIYSRLAEYRSEEGVVIVYGSMYGNTAEVAEMIASRLAAGGVRKIVMHNASSSQLSDMISDCFRYKGLIVGAPCYSMTLFPPVRALMDALVTRETKNKVFATFANFTWAPTVNKILADYAATMKFPVVASLQIKQSSDADTPARACELADKFMEAYNAC